MVPLQLEFRQTTWNGLWMIFKLFTPLTSTFGCLQVICINVSTEPHNISIVGIRYLLGLTPTPSMKKQSPTRIIILSIYIYILHITYYCTYYIHICIIGNLNGPQASKLSCFSGLVCGCW